ncbi:MAG: hypothetical protein DWQ04_34970 [Chloroflexi bacterium]|nr:MAG: hypothetical protein DWQ04_34970 [Chloroflexota bacterium]
MKKNNKARIVVLSTLAGLTLVFLGAAAVSFQIATKAHQNSPYMKMTRNHETEQPTTIEVVLPVETAVLPTATVAAVETAVATPSTAPTNTPIPTELPSTATLSPWEQVQKQVSTLRNRLERGTEGYEGLSTALEEAEPNKKWCSNLLIAIQDFNYINDTASAEAIQTLAQSQNCE